MKTLKDLKAINIRKAIWPLVILGIALCLMWPVTASAAGKPVTKNTNGLLSAKQLKESGETIATN